MNLTLFSIPKRKTSNEPQNDKSPTVSVIMRARNSSPTVAQALKALFSQNLLVKEVLFVDSSSTDNTLSIAKSYPVCIQQIAFENYFPGKVLNEALKQTKSEIIVFDNSDAVMLTPSTLRNLITRFENPSVKGCYSRQIPRPDAYTWVRRDYESSFPKFPPQPPWMKLSLSLAAIRRDMWLERPFYNDAWGSEDIEWGNAVKVKGYEISYIHNSLVMHSHNYSLKGLYGRKFIEGEAEAFIFKKSYSLLSCLRDILKSCIRDVFFYVKEGDFINIPKIPIIRSTYYWGYYQGHLYGQKRLKEGISDASRGQKEVLSRYE
jgi:rhamnosyltransferase